MTNYFLVDRSNFRLSHWKCLRCSMCVFRRTDFCTDVVTYLSREFETPLTLSKAPTCGSEMYTYVRHFGISARSKRAYFMHPVARGHSPCVCVSKRQHTVVEQISAYLGHTFRHPGTELICNGKKIVARQWSWIVRRVIWTKGAQKKCLFFVSHFDTQEKLQRFERLTLLLRKSIYYISRAVNLKK